LLAANARGATHRPTSAKSVSGQAELYPRAPDNMQHGCPCRRGRFEGVGVGETLRANPRKGLLLSLLPLLSLLSLLSLPNGSRLRVGRHDREAQNGRSNVSRPLHKLSTRGVVSLIAMFARHLPLSLISSLFGYHFSEKDNQVVSLLQYEFEGSIRFGREW